MKLFPQSLFGRLMIALILVVVVMATVFAWRVMRERQEVVFWGGESADLIEFLAETTEEIGALPQQQRIDRVRELLRTPLMITESTRRQSERARRYDVAAAARSYQKQLQRELGENYQVQVRPAASSTEGVIYIGGRRVGPGGPAANRPGLPGGRPNAGPANQLDVVVGLPGSGQISYRVPAPRRGAPLPRRIFAELVVFTGALALVLFLMTRGITRPLSGLATAAEAMSRGERPPPLPETGAKELKEATHAFNTMHERLERYMNSRNSLLAAISHDLRTPLTRMRLRSEKVADPELRERFQADVDEMNDMLKAALDLFRGMNDDEASVPVDVMDLLRTMCVDFAEMGAEVTLEGRANGPIDAKPAALKRCITNLVANAVKYGGAAHISVRDGSNLEIVTSDEGPGIPESALEKVFEPFYRLEDSRNPATGGTGLGLSIARDIAQAHGGSLVLRNRKPKGLEALLTLPRT